MFFVNFIFGVIIGIGFIIPGVSGGVLATIMGIYDKIIYSLTYFFKDFRKNFLVLFPIFLGSVLGILFFSKIILYLLKYKRDFISYVFIGLILGCIPFLLQEIKVKSNKKISILPFLGAVTLGISLYIIQNFLNLGYENTTPLVMAIGGVFYAIGKIVPGISGAALLMMLGIYEYLLEIIASPSLISMDIIIKLIPFIISFLISAVFIIKGINYLITKHFHYTYSAIIGFVVSSILFIIPDSFDITSLIIVFLSFLISYNLSGIKKKPNTF